MRRTPVLFWAESAVVLVFICGVAVLFTVLALARNLPSVDQIDSRQIAQSTRIYDRQGEVLLYEISAGKRRLVVPFEEIPQHLKDATIITEDRNFYTSAGFDWRGILRAAWANLKSGEIVQGGSTITQQLARNAFLTLDQTFSRKIREVILAVQLSRHYSKDKILWLYLNEIPYGPTIYGAGTASEAYFNKEVSELTLAESALLAALPRAPSFYSPWGSHTKELFERQRLILQLMQTAGKITAEEYAAALEENVEFEPQGDGLRAPHFVMSVQDYLVKKYGEDMVRTGGLQVTTTLDWKMQEIAERAVRDGATRNADLYQGKNAALVAQDPKTGQILAMVGSKDYADVANEGNFNVATQGLRQPGSTLKPFAYLTAFKLGLLPETVVFDTPTEFNTGCPLLPDYDSGGDRCFHPQNFDGRFRGPVSLRAALAQSINVPAVKVLYLAGLPNVLTTLADFGITTLSDPRRYGLSLVLGGGEVRLIELLGAYATLAADGYRREQTLLLEVRDSQGRVLEKPLPTEQRAAAPQYVRQVTDILTDLDARAELFGASLNLTTFPGHAVALKTGTTNDYRDAWAMGYVPNLAVGVWAGNNDNAPMQRRGSSLLAAVPIWNTFLAEALPLISAENFPRPAFAAAGKPILGGEYLVNGEVHSSLYYLDRQDLAGPPPADPTADAQFPFWEAGVEQWAAAHPEIFVLAPLGENDPPQVQIFEPAAGSFVKEKVRVEAQIRAGVPLAAVRVWVNGKMVLEKIGGLDNNLSLKEDVRPEVLEPQNLLEVEATDAGGRTAKAQVIVYRQ